MILTLVFIFAAVCVATFAVYYGWGTLEASLQVKRRLKQVSETIPGIPTETAGIGLLREDSAVDQLLNQLPMARAIRRELTMSGVNLTLAQFLLLVLASSVCFFTVVILWKGNMPAAVLAAVLAASLPYAYILNRKQKRRTLFDEQLPDALTMVARSLRAGHSLSTAVDLIGEELPEPGGGLFKLAHEQERLGIRITESLGSLGAQVDSVDYNFFVTIVRINSESGGNLSEILEKLAETIRTRLQIRRQVRVTTAEGRMSGYVLSALPVVLFCGFCITRPKYMEVFFTNPICKLILLATVLGQIIAFFIIRKIVDIRI